MLGPPPPAALPCGVAPFCPQRCPPVTCVDNVGFIPVPEATTDVNVHGCERPRVN